MPQTDRERLTALFDSVAKTTYDSNQELWDEVLAAVNLELCYQPTLGAILRAGTWRNAANPRAYGQNKSKVTWIVRGLDQRRPGIGQLFLSRFL